MLMTFTEESIEKIIDNSDIIASNWLHLDEKEKVFIITTTTHSDEIQLMKRRFERLTSHVELLVLEEKGKTIGMYFDEHPNALDGYSVIVGATDYSIVTTNAVKKAIERGGMFLSLPLSTNDGKSMLEYDFLQMDTKKSKLMAGIIKKYLDDASFVRVTTKLGTDITFHKKGRKAGFFNGDVRDGKGFSSASIELYVAPEETLTEGRVVVDGSLGYIGAVDKPFEVIFKDGCIVEIEDAPDGNRLREYIESFDDERMNIAAELGIGLNSLSSCCGNCYIEDESAYGTFHIGLGRNLALGGIQEASGHFDIVMHNPDIFADNRQIMSDGIVIVPEPQIY